MEDLYKNLKIIAVVDHPDHARFWPNKKIVVIYNNLNGTTNVFVVSQELEMIACPKVFEGDQNLIEFIRGALSP